MTGTISKLNPVQRQIIMGMIAGESPKEIAFQMQIAKAGVSMHLFRARAATDAATTYQLVAAFAADLVRMERRMNSL